MKHTLHNWLPLACLGTLLMTAGCVQTERVSGSSNPSITVTPAKPPAPLTPASQKVVEDYLRAGTEGDGAAMYALIANSERKNETPETLTRTAHDRYSGSTTWQILKSKESGNVGEVVVDYKGAHVDPNPFRFTLTREAGEWRIVQAPELHEREREGGIRIKL